MSMKDIKELRERTGAGVLDCKKALTKKDGDLEKAVEYLREKGIADAAKKAGRVAAQGKVNVVTTDDKKKGLITEVNCETDFVAKNDSFKQLVKSISIHLMATDKDDVDEVLSEEWYEDENKDVNTIIKEAIANIGENINLRRFQKLNSDGFLQEYIHLGGKIGVLVDVDGELNDENQKVAKNVAMHIAASNPDFLAREDVDEETIAKEKKIYKEQMINEGKPEHIIDQIVKGKIDKYYTQICLLEQAYVKDTDISVGDYLDNKDIDINKYVRYEIGEGIEVKKEDFAEEVMSEMNKE